MKKVVCFLLTVFVLFASLSLSVFSEGETRLTVTVPRGNITYTGSQADDPFGVAVGYSLAEDQPGLAGYMMTVSWDPTVLRLRTDYNENVDDKEMSYCCGCYFEDLFEDGLHMAPPGMYTVNYKEAKNGSIEVVSLNVKNMPDREAILFVLDFLPLCGDRMATVTLKVHSLASDSAPITEFAPSLTYSFPIGTPGSDLNGDGIFDNNDCIWVRSFAKDGVKPTDAEREKADVNGDGTVDVLDYMMLRRRILTQN